MTSPTRYLVRMGLFLLVILFLAFMLQGVLLQGFFYNPGLNGVILGVLLLGILWNFHLVFSLRREVSWLEILRKPREGLTVPPPPRLLAPMAGLLGAQNDAPARLVLSQQAASTLLDSLASRLEEGREISRYMTQLLIFLGLLGTFYGLILTMHSIANVIGSMSLNATDLLTVFGNVKNGLVQPLNSMATAFSASMFGLAGALVLGFLDLTAGQAQTRFFNELEEWLAGRTRLETPAAVMRQVGREMEAEIARDVAQSAALGAAAGAEAGVKAAGGGITIEEVTENNTQIYSDTSLDGVSLGDALTTWLPRVQDFMRLTTENVTLLQQNMTVLRAVVRDAEENRRQAHEAFRTLATAVEQLAENAATTQLLQQIERQLAGLRDDYRQVRDERHEERHEGRHRTRRD